MLIKRLLLCLALFAVIPSYAGVLSDLEESATKPKSSSSGSSKPKGNRKSSASDSDTIGGELAFSLVTWIIETTLYTVGKAIAYGGENSWKRHGVMEQEEKDSLYRLPGDGILPSFKLDTH